MEYVPKEKMVKHLDFSRPTYNEPIMDIAVGRLPSYGADNEESSIDSDISDIPKAKQTENISVFLRLKPYNRPAEDLYKFTDNTVILSQTLQQGPQNAERHYKFTSVLDENVNQVEIYNKIVRPVLTKPFDIRGSTFASYGVSSSGKTYTVLGDTSAGLVPRAITQIFTEYQSIVAPFPCAKIVKDQISILDDSTVEYEMEVTQDFLTESAKLTKGKMKNWSPDEIIKEHDFKGIDDIDKDISRLYIWISFVEIYNEEITDLLSNIKSTTRKLKIFSNGGNSYINGLTWLHVPDIKTAFKLLHFGLNKIKYAATGMNDQSSRSHTILTLNMIAEQNMEYQFSSFKFCDLAGAERIKKTGNVGDRLKEAGGINKSLLVLGRCLEAVQQNQNKVNKRHPDQVVPVRDSKLTLLLQSSLQGQEKFVMIVNLYPAPDFHEENMNVLKFGSIANQIVVRKSKPQIFKRPSYLLQQASELNVSLRNASFNNTITEMSDEDEQNESELDESFKWSGMSKEQLMHLLRAYKKCNEDLQKHYNDRLDLEEQRRKNILDNQRMYEEKIVNRGKEDIRIQKEYYERLMENMKIRYERQLSEAFNEIEDLEAKLEKYQRKGTNGNEVDEDEDDEDVIEVD